MGYFSFEKLEVYQKSLDFIDFVYTIINKFPSEEKYNLSSQLRRASTSVSLNIGEGSGKTNKDFNRYIGISKGSARECLVCFDIAIRRKYISEEDYWTGRKYIEELIKMMTGLSTFLMKTIENSR